MSMLDRLTPVLLPLLRGYFKTTQMGRWSQFNALPATADRVLFLGDSITEQGMWDEWFPELATLNRGVGGEVIAQVMARLDTAIIAPRAISLLIGTNDLTGLGESRKVDSIATQMRALVRDIRLLAPAAPLFINSVFPRSAFYRDRVLALNVHYKLISDEFGATYLDIWSALADDKGVLRADYTADGLHLTGPGYKIWTDVLRSHLQMFRA
jgi:lysophospholipase L1-like esterase